MKLHGMLICATGCWFVGLVLALPAGAQNRQGLADGQGAAGRSGTIGPRPAPRNPPPEAQVPFQLSSQELANLERVLDQWESNTAGFKTFQCAFDRKQYSDAFGPRDGKGKLLYSSKSQGEIKYAQPDKGMFRVSEKLEWSSANKNYADSSDFEHWICDGASIYQYDYRQSQLIERPLPPELQGQAIADGPIPFLFGARKEKLMKRYFVRIITPSTKKGEVWLEAFPRFAADAANFAKAELILSERDFLPIALRLTMPNVSADGGPQEWEVYTFSNCKANNPWEMIKRDFSKPRLPNGWKLVVEQPSSVAGGADPNGPARR
jgi:TIGR03009 family protein